MWAESKDVNTFVNAEIEMKKLRFHIPDSEGKSKCHKIHIGKRKMDCQRLKVHGCLMEEVKSDTYLGDVLASDGKNTLNIENRVSKGLGIVSQIMDILKNVSFGAHYFEIATTLREAMLVNGLLTNCEVWYGLTEKEVAKLEEVDRLLLRQIFQVASTCPIEALYLELGCVPIGLIIKARRIKYLHHLATRDEHEMLSKVFKAQWTYPAKRGEWTEQVKIDMKEFDMEPDLEQIRSKSNFSFKALVKKQTKQLALTNLNKTKEKHSKMENLQYAELGMQKYLKNEKITVKQARILFKFRTRMERFWGNFKGGKPPQPCPVCKDVLSVDTQEHSFRCKVLAESMKISNNYKGIFSSEVEHEIVITVENIEKFRKIYMEE